jgi:3'-phosphoadenosine 5'-phosphosulfate sulfotransferase (PAPS reductase)/FAD synthetase
MTGIAWWSGGVTSAVATKKAIEHGRNVQIYFCETGQHHSDNQRFLRDCELWYGQKIHTLTNMKWKTVERVLEHKYINGPSGAYCTKLLKKDVRQAIEKIVDYEYQIFGFEYEKRQIKRAERFVEQYPASKAVFPLIESGLTKRQCMDILVNAGIRLPEMYRLGYANANCIGCVKGGMGYWNKIRVDFPDVFNRTAMLERKAGHTCIKGVYLDELSPTAGRHEALDLPECGIYCEVEMMGIE